MSDDGCEMSEKDSTLFSWTRDRPHPLLQLAWQTRDGPMRSGQPVD